MLPNFYPYVLLQQQAQEFQYFQQQQQQLLESTLQFQPTYPAFAGVAPDMSAKIIYDLKQALDNQERENEKLQVENQNWRKVVNVLKKSLHDLKENFIECKQEMKTHDNFALFFSDVSKKIIQIKQTQENEMSALQSQLQQCANAKNAANKTAKQSEISMKRLEKQKIELEISMQDIQQLHNKEYKDLQEDKKKVNLMRMEFESKQNITMNQNKTIDSLKSKIAQLTDLLKKNKESPKKKPLVTVPVGSVIQFVPTRKYICETGHKAGSIAFDLQPEEEDSYEAHFLKAHGMNLQLHVVFTKQRKFFELWIQDLTEKLESATRTLLSVRTLNKTLCELLSKKKHMMFAEDPLMVDENMFLKSEIVRLQKAVKLERELRGLQQELFEKEFANHAETLLFIYKKALQRMPMEQDEREYVDCTISWAESYPESITQAIETAIAKHEETADCKHYILLEPTQKA